MISPEGFIPIAEDIDLILPIGEWVLYRACRDAKHWQNSAGKPLTITVNMSSRQFQKQNIPQLVSKVLDVTGLAAERLVLEITERLLIEDNQSTLSQFEELRSIGVGLAIDDFGTGFSSLSYLNKLPISILKIDRSFIQGINEHNSSLELVKTIISMASSLNLRVIAEGVETRQQGAILSANQCVLCQGYFFSKPLALADFERYLQQEGQHIDNISKVE
jgi:EAL domain-containing protein (putative c-di-GMP-specific phosphodiesterase class I)